jgi:hypothetical protein
LCLGTSFAAFEKIFSKVLPNSLLKRFATPEEVANMVVDVCSLLSATTNGAALRVDSSVVQTCF